MKKLKKFFKKIILHFFCFLSHWTKEKPVVLLYHSISDRDHFLSIPTKIFERQIRYLKENGFRFLKSSDLENIKNLPPKSVLITFDDGYKDNFINAVPILEKYQATAIFFIPVDLINKEMKGLLIMNWEEIKEISRNSLFEIGSHGLTHRKLHKLTIEEIEKEVKVSKKILEENLGVEIKNFAYPFGRYNEVVLKIIRDSGYKYGFSIKPGRLSKKIDKFQIPRFGIDNFSSLFFKDIFKKGYELYWRLRWIFYK